MSIRMIHYCSNISDYILRYQSYTRSNLNDDSTFNSIFSIEWTHFLQGYYVKQIIDTKKNKTRMKKCSKCVLGGDCVIIVAVHLNKSCCRTGVGIQENIRIGRNRFVWYRADCNHRYRYRCYIHPNLNKRMIQRFNNWILKVLYEDISYRLRINRRIQLGVSWRENWLILRSNLS